MLKRLFWFGLGFAAGVVAAAKANAYVRDHTPKHAREFIMGEDQDRVAMRTLQGLFQEFNAYRTEREDQLNSDFVKKFVGSKG